MKTDKSEQEKIYAKIYPSKVPTTDFSCRFWELCENRKKQPILRQKDLINIPLRGQVVFFHQASLSAEMSKRSPALWMKFLWKKWFRPNPLLMNLKTSMKLRSENLFQILFLTDFEDRANLQNFFQEVPKFHFREMKFILFQSLLSFSLSSSLSLLQYQLFFSASRQHFNSVVVFFHPFLRSQFFPSFVFFFNFLFNPVVNHDVHICLLFFKILQIHFLFGKNLFLANSFFKKSVCGCFFATCKNVVFEIVFPKWLLQGRSSLKPKWRKNLASLNSS